MILGLPKFDKVPQEFFNNCYANIKENNEVTFYLSLKGGGKQELVVDFVETKIGRKVKVAEKAIIVWVLGFLDKSVGSDVETAFQELSEYASGSGKKQKVIMVTLMAAADVNAVEGCNIQDFLELGQKNNWDK